MKSFITFTYKPANKEAQIPLRKSSLSFTSLNFRSLLLLLLVAMESYSYAPSYPDSGHSSPRSRDVDYENSSSWEDPINPQTAPAYYKVKFMCSYGGKILPRPHDNQLSYVGGETKIISVDRNIKFPALVAKLSSFCDYDSVLFKYQLPGEDLDALISVSNDEDLENLMQEYDRLYKLSPKPARLRLFLFGANPCQLTPSNSSIGTRSFGSDDSVTTKSEKERFVEALNSVAPPPPQAVVADAPPPIPAGNMDYLFGLEKGIAIAHAPPQQQLQPPVVVGRANDSQQTAVPPIQEPGYPNPIQKHIQDLQRLSIEEQHQAMVYRKKNEDDVVTGGYPIHGAGDYYFPNLQENVSQMNVPATVSMQPAAGYWREQHVPGGFPGAEHLYMIQTPQGAYGHHPQMIRPPVTAPTTQGYYTLQNMPPDQSYSNQQIPYNTPTPVKPVAAAAAAAAAVAPPPPPLQTQPPAYSEGYGVIRPGGGFYAQQVAYDNNGIGKQVYYTAHGGGGVMAAPPPPQEKQQVAAQYHQAIAASGVSGEVKALNQEVVKVVGKVNQV